MSENSKPKLPESLPYDQYHAAVRRICEELGIPFDKIASLVLNYRDATVTTKMPDGGVGFVSIPVEPRQSEKPKQPVWPADTWVAHDADTDDSPMLVISLSPGTHNHDHEYLVIGLDARFQIVPAVELTEVEPPRRLIEGDGKEWALSPEHFNKYSRGFGLMPARALINTYAPLSVVREPEPATPKFEVGSRVRLKLDIATGQSEKIIFHPWARTWSDVLPTSAPDPSSSTETKLISLVNRHPILKSQSEEHIMDTSAEDNVYKRNEDGSLSPARPSHWQEEHPWWVRMIYRILGKRHCSN